MKSKEFRPCAFLSITAFASIGIQLAEEDCDNYVYGAFFEEGNQSSKVSKSVVRYNNHNLPYFNMRGRRYYLSEFMKRQ